FLTFFPLLFTYRLDIHFFPYTTLFRSIDNENLWVVFHPQKQKCQLILRTNWHFYSRTKKTHYKDFISTTSIPSTIRYQPNTLKSCFLIKFIRNLITKTDTANATAIPRTRASSSEIGRAHV